MTNTPSSDSPASPSPKRATAEDIARLLSARDRILIVSHLRPDGDCLGSTAGLYTGLARMGKTVAAYNASGVSEYLSFIPNVDCVQTALPDWTPEVTVFVDCGGVGRVSPDFKPQGLVVNIDHHATNDAFGEVNYIDTRACAVGEQIFHVLNALEVEITPDIATALYVSVAADTGCFRYSSTNAHTFEIAAQLVEKGAAPADVSISLFESKTREEIFLTARCMSRLQYDCDGRMSWSELRWADFEEVGGIQHEPEGLSTDIRAIRGVEIGILFRELKGKGIRAGFRGKGNVDCAALAQMLGGGGHFNAAGYFDGEAEYEAERDRILGLARDLVLKS